MYIICRSQWPRGLRRRFASARMLRSWVRIPPGAWIFVCCECCVLSGRGLCDELITRPEESYRLCCVVVCDLETSRTMKAMTRVGSQRHRKKNVSSGSIIMQKPYQLVPDFTAISSPTGKFLPTAEILQVSDTQLIIYFCQMKRRRRCVTTSN